MASVRNILARSLVRVDVDADAVQMACNAAGFDSGALSDLVITRRGCSISLELRPNSKKAQIDWADSVSLLCAKDETKEISLKLQNLDVRAYGAVLQVTNTKGFVVTKRVW